MNDHFIFAEEMPIDEQSLYHVSLQRAGNWAASQYFSPGEVSGFLTEDARLRWAPLICAAMFGEGSAFSGFGPRIAQAKDLSAKTWFCLHLLDESKHADGFNRLGKYFFPTYWTRPGFAGVPREVVRFFGHSRLADLPEWLISLQILETYTKYSYTALTSSIRDERTQGFLSSLLDDESRHLAFIRLLIRRTVGHGQRAFSALEANLDKYVALANEMYLGKDGCRVEVFDQMGICVKQLCDDAEADVRRRLDLGWHESGDETR